MFFTGLIATVGVMSSLTHGSLYGGGVPGFFYGAMVLTAGLFGFGVNANNGTMVWHWFNLPLLKKPYQELHWKEEGKLFRLYLKNGGQTKATSILSRNKGEL